MLVEHCNNIWGFNIHILNNNIISTNQLPKCFLSFILLFYHRQLYVILGMGSYWITGVSNAEYKIGPRANCLQFNIEFFFEFFHFDFRLRRNYWNKCGNLKKMLNKVKSNDFIKILTYRVITGDLYNIPNNSNTIMQSQKTLM